MTTEHADHGSTPAAWTVVVIVTIAFIVGTLGVMLANWVMFWIGVGILILGVVVGKVMAMAGLGKKRPAHA
ncbi:MAG: HGxxPAAW family protein [Candidatus Nanopelagicales bacterium]